MLNAPPYEVIAAPWTLYVAPEGTQRPAVDEEPNSSDWTLVGSAGPLNYDEAGINLQQPQAITFWRSLGDSGSRKAFRTSEDLKIGLMLVDLTPEQYALAINGNIVTETPASTGVPGSKKIGLSRGFTVDTRALLLRGPSPAMANGVSQYWCPRAAQTGSPAPVLKRDAPASLAVEWTAMVDPDATSEDEYFGVYEIQTAEADT